MGQVPLSMLTLNKAWASVCIGRKRNALNNERFFFSCKLPRHANSVKILLCAWTRGLFCALGIEQWCRKCCEQILLSMDFIFYFLRLVFGSSWPGGVLSGCSELAPFSGIPHLLSTHCSLIKKRKKKKHTILRKELSLQSKSQTKYFHNAFFCPLFQNAVVGKGENKSLKRKNILCKGSSSNVVVHVMGDRLEWQRCVVSLEKMQNYSQHLVSVAHCESEKLEATDIFSLQNVNFFTGFIDFSYMAIYLHAFWVPFITYTSAEPLKCIRTCKKKNNSQVTSQVKRNGHNLKVSYILLLFCIVWVIY